MNLKPLFEMQRELDNRIVEEKGLKGQDLIPNTFLASLVELGECCNEWRGFKHWSNDQEPRTRKLRKPTMNDEDKEWYNPLLEELVDKLHFLLSIGNQIGLSEEIKTIDSVQKLDTTHQFIALFHATSVLYSYQHIHQYEYVLGLFIGLVEMLGFTEEQIENAYMEKNAINHLRQTNGY